MGQLVAAYLKAINVPAHSDTQEQTARKVLKCSLFFNWIKYEKKNGETVTLFHQTNNNDNNNKKDIWESQAVFKQYQSFILGVSVAEIDKYKPNPCLSRETCSSSAEGYQCSCPLGFTEKNCEEATEMSFRPPAVISRNLHSPKIPVTIFFF